MLPSLESTSQTCECFNIALCNDSCISDFLFSLLTWTCVVLLKETDGVPIEHCTLFDHACTVSSLFKVFRHLKKHIVKVDSFTKLVTERLPLVTVRKILE